MIFILLRYLLSFVTVTSSAHQRFYALLFRLLPQFLCPTVCVYGGTTVPRGVVGDRHLVTIPQGVVGDRLPWGGEGEGGGGVLGIGVAILRALTSSY